MCSNTPQSPPTQKKKKSACVFVCTAGETASVWMKASPKAPYRTFLQYPLPNLLSSLSCTHILSASKGLLSWSSQAPYARTHYSIQTYTEHTNVTDHVTWQPVILGAAEEGLKEFLQTAFACGPMLTLNTWALYAVCIRRRRILEVSLVDYLPVNVQIGLRIIHTLMFSSWGEWEWQFIINVK